MPVLLPIHIVAAGLGIVAGAVALSSAKGGTLHRRSGIVFVYAMAGMCGTAAVMAAVKGQIVNVMAGSLTAYLVITALLTVRPPSASSRRLTIASMLVALALGLTAVTFGFQALASVSGERYGAPAFPLFMFGTVGLLGSVGDLRTIQSGGLRGARRLTRHLWRMCWALWIATASFFGVRLAQFHTNPELARTGSKTKNIIAGCQPLAALGSKTGCWIQRAHISITARSARRRAGCFGSNSRLATRWNSTRHDSCFAS